MSDTLQLNQAVISIENGVRIKKPYIEIKGDKIPYGDLFIDIPVKILLLGVNQELLLIIESTINIDGIGLRRLDLENVRNIVKKGNNKTSTKNNPNLIQKTGSNIISGIHAYSGTSWILDIIKIFKKLFNKNDGEDKFSGDLFINKKRIGKANFNIQKFNKLKQIITRAEIYLMSKNKGLLTHRINIPIEGLSRDHSKEIIIQVKTIVQVLVDDFETDNIELKEQSISLGGIGYTTLNTSFDDLWKNK